MEAWAGGPVGGVGGSSTVVVDHQLFTGFILVSPVAALGPLGLRQSVLNKWFATL